MYSSMVKMNGLCPPLTSTYDYACMTDKRAKAVSAFAHDNYDSSLHLLVLFYIAARNMGTIWAPNH